MEALLHHAHNEITPASKLRGFINIDPIEIAARTGIWHEEKMYELGELARLAPKGMKFMCANANFYGACGSSAATQLGLAAAHLDFYLSNFGEVGIEQYWVAITAGTYIFEEIAKHRALRMLWKQLLKEYDLPEVHLEIYTETSTTHQSGYDMHTNLLRATSSAFGAIAGGADAVQIRPYNSVAAGVDAEGERLALNQHFILAYESGMDCLMDPAAGSYFIENKTAELVNTATQILTEVRSLGGLVEALKKGWVQDRIENEVNVAMPKDVLGVNLYPLEGDELPKAMTVSKLTNRATQKARHKNKQIEPLCAVRWAAKLEAERQNSK
ncbi:MAG TPA: hypothetical protein DIT65_03525 [Cryomorphaceae bacterium]|nr:hypothetical protein [Cryomorphaceae bacterium]